MNRFIHYKTIGKMRTSSYFFIILLATILLAGCKNSDTQYKPNITGSMGEMLLVMDDKWKTSESGKLLIEMLTQPLQGLPQVENIFTLSIVPHRVFSSHMKIFRNLIITTISSDVETEGVKFFTDNAWAKEQALMRIEAKTPERFIEIVQENELRIVGFFIRAERQRSLRYYTKYINSELTKTVKDKLNIDFVVPINFKGNRSDETFTWISNETALTSQGAFLYAYDYVGEGTLSREYLLNKRDSILRARVPGPADGSYMGTEYELPITYKTLTVNGHNVVELRGLWKIIGYPMGGPFVMFAHHDSINNRVVVTDGYVYSPEKPNKRNLVWQVESVLYSLKFPSDKVEE
jgi:hypothetical protein